MSDRESEWDGEWDGEGEGLIPRWLLWAMATGAAIAFAGISGLAVLVHWLKG